ncbi:hypothetical protein ES695_11190 [Candidatus Atribacteria bacterium 1244-E10-H5-B2]|nr:MAG: hypothetical protein ES695_11190 [Candidatus Atribacteria bacterium 1244-E10-H5-B2]
MGSDFLTLPGYGYFSGYGYFPGFKTLKEMRSFYKWKLKDKNLTEKDRDKFLKALKLIEKIIKEKEQLGKKLKHKKFIPYDHKAVF